MQYSTLNPIQKIRHHGYPFHSNDSAVLIYYGSVFCWVTLLE